MSQENNQILVSFKNEGKQKILFSISFNVFFVENNSILNDVMPFENKTTNNKRVQPFSNKLGISDEIEVQREFLIFFFL